MQNQEFGRKSRFIDNVDFAGATAEISMAHSPAESGSPEPVKHSSGAVAAAGASAIAIDDWRDGEVELSALDGINGTTFLGIDSNDFLGSAVSSAGDINNDGFDDLIIGAYGDPNLSEPGEVYVVYGNANGLGSTFDLSTLDGNNGFRIEGIDGGDTLGFAVSEAGDLNGDGRADFAVSAIWAAPGTRSLAGETYVIFGGVDPFPANLDLTTLDGDNGFVINGVDALDYSGYAISDAGDVNGDGISDLVISAYLADPDGQRAAGETYVVFGSSSGFSSSLDLSALDGSNGFVINGIDAGDYSGLSASGAGDINGDGFADIIIGAPFANNTLGECYVVFGGASGFATSIDAATLNGANGFVISGLSGMGAQLTGESVSGAGDVNGDGISDLIIGASAAYWYGLPQAGAAYVIYGSTTGFSANINVAELDGANGFVMTGLHANQFMGRSVSEAGDVNGDGIDDFIIGSHLSSAPGGGGAANPGSHYVVFGREGGFGAYFDLATLDGSNGFAIDPAGIGDHSGIDVDSAGDLNGDGYDDLVVGAFRADPDGRTDAGATYVIYGHTSNQTEGTFRGETLRGAAGNDTLNGYGGNDSLVGLGGDDYLNGGAGADFLRGADGDDFYDDVTFLDTIVEYGNRGNDTVRTYENDYVLSDHLENLLLSGRGAVTGSGNALDNQLVGSIANNSLFGLDGDDVLEGLRGADTLDGGAGSDRLEGGIGNDILLGGEGNDVLIGGAGRDTLTGGAGADSFAFFDGDFGDVATSADHIADFSRAEGDRIDLSGLDAIIGTPESESFAFVGTAAFSGAAGELRYIQRDGFVIVQGDTDGDGLADFGIRVDNLTDLTAADFVL